MSSIQHIVASVDGSDHDARVLKLAATLANRFDAGLEAVFANVPPFIPATIDGFVAPQIIEAQQETLRQRAKAAKTAVASLTLSRGSPTWTEADGLTADIVLSRARYADLTVLPQYAPEESDTATEYDTPAEIVMGLGRPVLMVPYAGTFADVGKRVLVAWNGKREAVRAIADALPFLETASEVSVLSVNPDDDASGIEADLQRWMAAHRINGKARTTRAKDIDVGDVILSAAADHSADLIVMGAYGRARVRELILGGVTHTIFRHMTAPVLMSH
jgi:nucleotide-binding universal stress UspA family protein